MIKNSREGLPTREELQVWRDFIETTEVLRSRLAGQMQNDSGLSLGEYKVLLALTEAPDRRYRPSALAQKIGWERSRLSHQLRRMESRALVERVECEADSRGAEVVITRAGTEAFRDASVPHLRHIRKIFVDALESEQLEQIATITQSLRAQLGD